MQPEGPSSAFIQKMTGPPGQDEAPSGSNKLLRRRHHMIPYLLLVTYFFSLLMLFFSAYFLLYGGNFRGQLSTSIPLYFYVILIFIETPYISAAAVVILVIILYCLLLLPIGRSFREGQRPSDTAMGYFGMMGPFLLIGSVLITLIETSLNIPILNGSGTSSSEYFDFLNLIYAPFVEEIGFRMIPVGIVTFIPFLIHIMPSQSNRSRYLINPAKAFFIYLVAPGYLRSRFGGRSRWVDLVMILVSSAIFAYAHVYFGSWAIGKIAPVFFDGIILCVGYLKFGLYVDIPLHFFLNDYAGLGAYVPAASGIIIPLFVWSIVCAVIASFYSSAGIKRFFTHNASNEVT